MHLQVVGVTPFAAPTTALMLERMRARARGLRLPRWMPPEARDFVAVALSWDPAQRPSMQELAEHRWLRLH